MGFGRFVVAAFVILGGVAFAGFGWFAYQDEQSDVNNAVEREGVVQSVDIEEDVDRRDRDDDGIRETERSYEPVVRYTYTYEGQNYTSDSVFPGGDRQFDSRSEAADYTEAYDPGDTVTVYVNSEEPSSAFLVEQTDTLLYYGLMAVGVVLGLFGLYIPFGRSG